MERKAAPNRARSPPVRNQNGQIIISCMKSLNEPATALQILKEVSIRTNNAQTELRPYVIAILNAGVRFGFIARKSRRYELDMPQVADLFKGITATPRRQGAPTLRDECSLPSNETNMMRSSVRLMRKAKIRDRMNIILEQLSQRDISASSKVLITLMNTTRDTTSQYKSTVKQRNFHSKISTTPEDDVIVISDSSSTSSDEK